MHGKITNLLYSWADPVVHQPNQVKAPCLILGDSSIGMDQFATRGHWMNGKQCYHITLVKKYFCLKQSFYEMPSRLWHIENSAWSIGNVSPLYQRIGTTRYRYQRILPETVSPFLFAPTSSRWTQSTPPSRMTSRGDARSNWSDLIHRLESTVFTCYRWDRRCQQQQQRRTQIHELEKTRDNFHLGQPPFRQTAPVAKCMSLGLIRIRFVRRHETFMTIAVFMMIRLFRTFNQKQNLSSACKRPHLRYLFEGKW